MTSRTLTALCALATSTVMLSGCSTDIDTGAASAQQMHNVALKPTQEIAVDGAGNARALELSDAGALRMTVSDHAATAYTARVNTDTGAVDQKRTVLAPSANDDPTFHMFDFDDEKINETAARAADLAEKKFISEQGTSPAPKTNELSRDMYAATFALDVLRARLGYGATQLYNEDHKRSEQAVWQLGAGDTIGLLDATGKAVADDKKDQTLPLQGSFPTIERSIGLCAVDNPDATTHNSAEHTVSMTSLDGNDITSASPLVISTSGSSAIVPRSSNGLEEQGLVQATLPHTLDKDQRNPDRGERLTLMGLGELDCTTNPTGSGTPENNIGIFATVNTELAKRTAEYQNATNALRDYLDEHEGTEEQADTPARPREETAGITPVVPDEKGTIAVMTGDGAVHALLDSSALVKAHPELKDKEITTVAVDPKTFDATRSLKAKQANQPWYERLFAPFKDDPQPETQRVTLWVTYDGVDTVYRAEADVIL